MGLHFFFYFALILVILTLCAAQNSAGGGGGVTVLLWCVAKNNAEDAALQTAIDWACGAGGANCGPIQPGGPCYDPSDIQRTASYAFNDYFLKHGLTQDNCNFDNTAALSSLNPSHGNCKFPSGSNVSNGGNITGSDSGGLGTDSADLSGTSSPTTVNRWSWGLLAIYLFYGDYLDFLRLAS